MKKKLEHSQEQKLTATEQRKMDNFWILFACGGDKKKARVVAKKVKELMRENKEKITN